MLHITCVLGKFTNEVIVDVDQMMEIWRTELNAFS